MNDRYLFKAKRVDNGKWVQGYYYQIWENGYILWGMTNDVPNMIALAINNEAANAFDIPEAVFNGNITEKSDATNEFITYACSPVAEQQVHLCNRWSTA